MDAPFEDSDLLGADYAGMALVFWLVPDDDDVRDRATRDERERFAQDLSHREGPLVRLVRGDARVASLDEQDGRRSGRTSGVGRLLLDAFRQPGRLQT